jgi:eukaryotic-like serine/threonine-protein kinase
MSVHPPPRELAETQDDSERPASSPSPAPRAPAMLPTTNVAATLAHSPVYRAAAGGEIPSVPGYEILAELGRGAMGVVYQARQMKPNRLVALKMILHGTHASAIDLGRFLAEGEAVAQLQHANIVQIHEIGEHAGLPFFCLEYVEGGTLAERLQVGPLPPQEAAALMHTLARAMAYAHEQGLIHRDLKPGNVLLAADGSPKITDFGLVKRLDPASPGRAFGPNLTATGAVLGTPSYMAPEQAGGKKDVTALCDVYALGAILYEMVTGRPPFQAPTPLETMMQAITDEPAPPSQLQTRVPRDLETICLKCLRKEPEKRYASAAALAEDVRRFQAGEPILARPVGRVERAWRWCRRKPAAAAVALLAVLMLATAIAVPALFAVWANHNAVRIANEQGKTIAALQLAEERLRDSRRQSATSTLERALLLCEQGEVGHGLLWLTRGLETARLAEDKDLEQAFRWNLGAWSREVHRLDRMLPHPESVLAVAFSPDGALAATACKDGKVRLWETVSGRLRGEPISHPEPVQALAFHPGGELLLTGCEDGMARLWKTSSGALVGNPLVHYRPADPATVWPWKRGVMSVAFSPDGRTLMTGGGNGNAQVWETATGAAAAPPIKSDDGVVFAVAFRPDGQAVLTGGRNWNLQQWDPKTSGQLGPSLRHYIVYAAAYSPDGKFAAAGYLQSNSAQRWNLAAGRMLEPPLRHQAAVKSVSYSPDGRVILTGSDDQTARLWEADTGRPIGSALEHTAGVNATAFSSDGQTIATASGDGMVRLWKIASGGPLRTFPSADWVRSAAFSPDGKQLLTGSCDSACRLWDLSRGRQIGPAISQAGWVSGVAFRPDGKTALVVLHREQTDERLKNGPHLYRWDLGSRQLLASSGTETDNPWRIAVDPGCSRLVTGYYDRSFARIWDAATGEPRGKPLRHDGPVKGVAVSANGQTILTGSDDKTTRLWDARTGSPLGPPVQHPYGISAVAFSRDGQFVLTGSQGQTVQLWEAETWKPLGAPLRHQGEVNCVAFVGGNELVVSASEDSTARFWFAPSSHPVGPALLHKGRVSGIALSPDGKTLATASDDGTAKVWAVPAPVAEEPEELNGWVQTLTGLTMDDRGSIGVLTAKDWQSRRDHFADLGPHAALPTVKIIDAPPEQPKQPPPLPPIVLTPPRSGNRPATPEQLAGWVKQLADKEAKTQTEAAHALEEVGPPALKALEEAANHPEPAVRNRVRHVKDRIAAAEAVAPRRVSLKFKDAPVADAVKALAEKTGVRLSYPPPAGLPKTVTLELDGVPFLEALDRLCQAAGLVRSFNGSDGWRLSDGKAVPAQMLAYGGPIRFQAFSMDFSRQLNLQTDKQVRDQLRLLLFLERELRGQVRSHGPLRVVEARDDAGRSLLTAPATADFSNPIQNGAQLAVWLQPPPLRGGTLKRLRIVLPVEVMARPRDLLTAADFAIPSGKTFAGNDGVRLKVHSVIVSGGEAVQVQFAVSVRDGRLLDPNGLGLRLIDAMGREHQPTFLNIQMMVTTTREPEAEDLLWWSGSPQGPFPGQFPWAALAPDSRKLNRLQWTGHARFATQEPLGAAAKLTLFQFDRLRTELPFEFRDLPLP